MKAISSWYCAELATHSKEVVFWSNHFEKFFQVWPGMYKSWLVFLATSLLTGAWLGHIQNGAGEPGRRTKQ